MSCDHAAPRLALTVCLLGNKRDVDSHISRLKDIIEEYLLRLGSGLLGRSACQQNVACSCVHCVRTRDEPTGESGH